ncbi:MAG TPA: hypothetical protein VMW35_20250 [Myxococcota bacterium]|nr:hypothetical protein [Myxococcota bacterium]
MSVWRYSRWDGSQAEFRLDAEAALDALSDLLMEGLDLEQAMAWMREHGFELAGQDFRVMGLDELQEEIRRELAALAERFHLDRATDELRRRLDDLLRREDEALRRAQGTESARWNAFRERRDAPADSLSERIERFRDHAFEDPEAGDELRELLEELDRLRALERFQREQGRRFRGPEAAGYEEAQRLRERFEALQALAKALAEGRLEEISPEELEDLLSEGAVRSLVWLRGMERELRDAGYLRGKGGRLELTPRAVRRLGANALAEVYGALRQGRPGTHPTSATGTAIPRPDETRPFAFGDRLDLDVAKTLLGAAKRHARATPGAPLRLPIELELEDFEVRESDHSTTTTTVLLLDMSWSMSWAGRFPAAKRVALALDHLIRTRHPRDRFFVVGFSTRARELRIGELPEAVWDMGDPFTNLQEGLMVAERLIAKHPSPSPQILVVTDGQPTAYFRGRELHVEWPSGFGGISPRAAEATLREVRRVTRRGITINTFMLDAAPELVAFVERMTRINRGRALYTAPSELGSFLLVDYLARRRTRRG